MGAKPDAYSLSERETNCNFIAGRPAAWWCRGWRNHARVKFRGM